MLKHTVVGFPLLISPSCVPLELMLLFFLRSPVARFSQFPIASRKFSSPSLGGCWRVCPVAAKTAAPVSVPGRGVVPSAPLAISVRFAHLASSLHQNEEKRNLSLGGHVGFDSLPDQLVSKSVTQGFSFNILCVGEQHPLQTDTGRAGGTGSLGPEFLGCPAVPWASAVTSNKSEIPHV